MKPTRRRFLTLASAACLGAALPARAYQWQGTALGAHAQIILDHPNAKEITRAAMAEIARLERVFSLYKSGSELSRLNAAGRLEAPSFELLECLAVARDVHRITEGAFDPSIQPLWAAMAQSYSAGRSPTAKDLTQARSAIGFDRVRFDASAIELAPGQALTLNGIAQGYIADRVADLMQRAGVQDVLINTGEILAMGPSDTGAGWPVRIDRTDQKLFLNNRAIATSASFGTVLDADGKQGHILSPDPRAAVAAVQVSVSAPTAALADGLSTGLCVFDSLAKVHDTLRKAPDARLESYLEIGTL